MPTESLPPGVRKYIIGFYRPGPNRPHIPVAERPQLLSDHLAFLARMRDRGELIVYGPVEDEMLAGIVIFSTDSMDHARTLMREEPKIARGDLVLDFREWYAAEGLRLGPPQA